jgi:WYL domain
MRAGLGRVGAGADSRRRTGRIGRRRRRCSHLRAALFAHACRSALRDRASRNFGSHALEHRLRREDGAASAGTIRPLGLYYWGKVWTLVAWCALRTDFRSFRLDRIRERSLGEAFTDEPGKTLDVFMERVGAT